MVDDRITELINKEMDRTILPAEQTALNEYRSNDPEVAELCEDLRQLATALDGVKDVEAPSTLKARVMRELQPRRQKQRGLFGVFSSVAEFLAPKPALRLAYAFSGGIVAGIALFAVLLNPSGRPSFTHDDAVGTMVLSSTRNLEKGLEFPVNAAKVQGVVSTHFGKDIRVLTVQLNAEAEVITRISFDPTSWEVRAVRRSHVSGDGLNVQGGEIEFRNTGSHAYEIYFGSVAASASPVRVAVYSSGNAVFDSKIPLWQEAR